MKPKTFVYAGAYIALGFVLPIAFHSVGLGQTFLPMHIPILLAGLLSGPGIGVIVGVITPLLSAVLTGMPPISPPIAFMMAVELPVYGLLAGLAYRRWNLNKLVALVFAILVGRLVYGVTMALTLPLFGLEAIPPLFPITTGLITGFPGLVIQLVLIPTTLSALEKHIPSPARLEE